MSSDPNLALCSVGELFGGVERHLLGMCTWLLRQGHRPTLVLFHDSELAGQARRLGVEPMIITTSNGLDLTGPRRLADGLKSRGVDVVHAHGYKAVVNCALARRYHDFALVRTVHGLVEPRGGLSAAWLKAKFYTGLERYWGRRAGAAVTYVTEDLRSKHLRVDKGLASLTIPNGIDPLIADNYPRPEEFDDDTFEVVAVGRVSEVKGLPFALQAMNDIPGEMAVRLSIVGTGPLVVELQSDIEARGLGNRVRVLGFRKNVYDYLANADALLMPSLHEGAPYTILEAMSLGLPVIASRTGGLPELLIDGESGFLVDVGDAAGLARVLLDLIGDKGLRQRIGGAGMVRQRTHFDLDGMGAALWDLYCAQHHRNEA